MQPHLTPPVTPASPPLPAARSDSISIEIGRVDIALAPAAPKLPPPAARVAAPTRRALPHSIAPRLGRVTGRW